MKLFNKITLLLSVIFAFLLVDSASVSAHTPWFFLRCGKLTLSADYYETSPSGKNNVATIVVDGVTKTYPFGSKLNVSIDLDETVAHSGSWAIDANLYVGDPTKWDMPTTAWAVNACKPLPTLPTTTTTTTTTTLPPSTSTSAPPTSTSAPSTTASTTSTTTPMTTTTEAGATTTTVAPPTPTTAQPPAPTTTVVLQEPPSLSLPEPVLTVPQSGPPPTTVSPGLPETGIDNRSVLKVLVLGTATLGLGVICYALSRRPHHR